MKKILALFLTLALLAGCVPALAEEAAPVSVEMIEPAAETEAWEIDAGEDAAAPVAGEDSVPALQASVDTEMLTAGPAVEAAAGLIAGEPPAERSPEPSAEPLAEPGIEPSAESTPESCAEPVAEASEEPDIEPAPEAAVDPAAETSAEPTGEPAAEATVETTMAPTAEPTMEPAVAPTMEPIVEPTPEPVLPQIILSAGAVRLGIGEKLSLIAALDSGGAAEFSFASENAKIAAVDEEGLITAKKAGETVIRVTCGELSAECAVTVIKAPTKVTLSATKLSMGAGQTAQLTAELNNGNESKVTFTSSKASVATVDENGVITAVGKGTAKISAASYNKKKATCTVTVLAAPESLSINETALTLPAGMPAQVRASVNKGAAAEYSYASSDENVASVDASGNITTLNPGSAVITVTTYNGLAAECAVTVTEAPAVITLNAETAALGVKETFRLAASNDQGCEAGYTYASDNAKIAAVDKNGLVTAKKAGSAVITVTSYNGLTASCAITVGKAPSRVTLSAKALSMGEGQTETIRAEINNGSIGALSFSSNKESVAVVDENGVITAVGKGKATITAQTYNKKKAACTLTVLAAPAELTLAETGASIPMGMSFDLKPGVEEGAMANYSCISSDESIATVTDNGVVTAHAVGTALITVNTYNGLSAACEITVTPAPGSVSLNAEAIELGVGEKYRLSAEADVESPFTYKSQNARIATIDADGMITAKKVGTTVIAVSTFNGVTAECTVAVKKAPAKVTLNERNIELATGESFRLTAELNSGSAGRIVFSSNDACATVDESGLVTAVSAGEAVITAESYNGRKASCTVTVSGPYVSPAEDFEYTIDGNSCTITGYDGDDERVVIPDTIAGVPVTALSGSFGGDIYSLAIPAGVSSIRAGAFQYCRDLHEIIVAEGNSRYETQDGVLFEKGGVLLCYPAGKAGARYSVPESCTGIAAYALSNSSYLKWIVLPASVKEIGESAFSGGRQFLSLIVEKDSAAESYLREQGLSYDVIPSGLAEEEKEIEFRDADLARAEKLGLNVDCADESTVTAAEYMQMLDWFISQAAPERMEEWKAMLPNARASEQPFGRDDAMLALYSAAEFVGESYLVNMYDGTVLNNIIGEPWKQYSPNEPLFEDVLGMTPSYGNPDWGYYTNAYFFALGQGSRYTASLLLDYDPVSNSLRPEDLITPEEALASVVRLLDAEEAAPDHNETSAAEKEIEDSIDAQREAILNSESEYEAKGKVYYVSPNGDDSNDGLSPETAFKTLDRINSAALAAYGESVIGSPDFPEFMNVSKDPNERLILNPGDVVLFERGMEWRGMLRGAEGVTYSAYGEGAKPVIMSSPESGVGADKWELVEGTDNIWKYHIPMQDCGGILLDENQVATKTTAYWNGEKYIYVGEEPNQSVENGFEIYEDFSWKNLENLRFFNYMDYSNGQEFNYAKWGELYLRCDAGNPGLLYGDIEFFTGSNSWNQGVFASNCDNIIVDNLSFKYSSGGVGLGMDERSAVEKESTIIRNCEVSWSGGKQQNYGSLTPGLYRLIRCGDGIAIDNNTQVYNNYVHHMFDFGITIEGYSASVPEGEEIPAYLRRTNNNVYNNLIEYCAGGIAVVDFTAMHSMQDRPTFDNIRIAGNTVAYTGAGWSHAEDLESGHTHMGALFLAVTPSYKNILVENNTLYKTWDIGQLVSINYFGDIDGVMKLDKNIYIQNENGGLGYISTYAKDVYAMNYRFTYSDYADLVIKHHLYDGQANILPTDLLALGLGPIALSF